MIRLDHVVRALRAVGAFAAVVSQAHPAAGQSVPRCEAEIGEADAVREGCFARPVEERARWRCVIDTLEARRQRGDAPMFRYAQGLASMRAGEWSRAWNLLTNAIASRDPCVIDVEQNQGDLAAIRPHVALLAPVSDVRGARLDVDGVELGELPLAHSFAVNAGAVRVRVAAPGYEPYERTMPLAAGGEWHERVNLRRIVLPPPPPSPRPTTLQPVGWALVGTGAALGVAGAVLWGFSWDTASELAGYCDGPSGESLARCSGLSSGVRQGEGGRVVDAERLCGTAPDGSRLATLCGRNGAFPVAAWALGATGVAALVAGVVTVLIAPRRPHVTTSMWMQPGGAGVALQGAF